MDSTNNPVPSEQASAPQKKHHHFIALVILIVILVIVGGGSVLANTFGLFASPQNDVKNAFLATQNISTLHTIATITADATTSSGDQTVKVALTGDTDKTDKTNPNIDVKINYNEAALSGSAEVRLVNSIIYAQLNQLSVPAFASFPYFNKWYSISKADLLKIISQYGSATTTINALSMNTGNLNTGALYAIVQKDGLFRTVSSQGTASDNGGSVKNYEITIDKSALVPTFIDLNAEIKKEQGQPVPVITDDQKQSFEDSLANIDFDPITLQVGAQDGYVHDMTVGITIAVPANDSSPAIASLAARGLSKVHISADVAYSQFNNKVTITAPATSQSLYNVIAEYLSSARTQVMAMPAQ